MLQRKRVRFEFVNRIKDQVPYHSWLIWTHVPKYYLEFYLWIQQDEAAYAQRIQEAKDKKGLEEESSNGEGGIIGDIKYKIDGVEKVKIDWHDWDRIGEELRR